MVDTDEMLLKNDRLLRAANGHFSDKLPVWIMRNAGPYLPEFEEFRKKDDYFEICQNPEVASEVTLSAVKKYNLDSAIIFTDISVIPKALGMEVEMRSGSGPFLPKPLSLENMDQLNPNGIVDRLKYIRQIITLTTEKLRGKVPLVGFSESPWTLLSYMLEGDRQKSFKKSIQFLRTYPRQSEQLLKLLTSVIIDYFVMQVEAGAEILQVFDNCSLTRSDYFDYSLPFLKEIRKLVEEKLNEKSLPQVPMILFTRNPRFCLDNLEDLGYEIISLNWRVEPQIIRALLRSAEEVVVQENIDPVSLKEAPDDLGEILKDLIESFSSKRYIVNIGYGMYLDNEPKTLQTFFDVVHSIPHKCC